MSVRSTGLNTRLLDCRGVAMICQKCHAEAAPAARFCNACGSPLSLTNPDLPSLNPDLVRNFTGREWLFRRIDDWLTRPKERYFLLTGEPGSGQTTLVFRLCQFARGEATPPPDCLALGRGFLSAAHFCSARDRRSLSPPTLAESLNNLFLHFDDEK